MVGALLTTPWSRRYSRPQTMHLSVIPKRPDGRSSRKQYTGRIANCGSMATVTLLSAHRNESFRHVGGRNVPVTACGSRHRYRAPPQLISKEHGFATEHVLSKKTSNIRVTDM